MNTNGIMEDIRNLLNEGKPSAEVIGLGYAQSTVYKAQRQLRKASYRTDQPVTQVLVTNMASEGWSELREENSKLRQQMSQLEALTEEITAERDTLKEELELERRRKEEFETEASQAQQMRVRLAAIEPEARAAGELRQGVKGLAGQIRNTNAARVQEVQHWKDKFEQERESRQAAETLAAKRSSEIDQLKAENQRLIQEPLPCPNWPHG